MITIRAYTNRHSVLIYFALTFAISWGGLLAIGGVSGLSGTTWQSDPRLPLLAVAMLAGPSTAGLLLTGLVTGRAGFRELLSRLLRWRVGVGWYAVALLPAPLVFAAVHAALSLFSPAYRPGMSMADDKVTFALMGTLPALMVGFFEELGWTGFAVPRLRLRYGALVTGLVVGVLWGAWHLLTNDLWIADAYSGGIGRGLFLTLAGLGLLLGQLPAYRVLIVRVYDQTGSLAVVMLMHASLSACTFVFGPSAVGLPLLIYGFVLAAVWWIIVATVAAGERERPSQQPLGRHKGGYVMMNLFREHHGMNILGQGGKIILFMLPSLIGAILADTYLPEIAALPAGLSAIKPVGYLLLVPGVLLWGTGVAQLMTGFSSGKLVTSGAYGVVRNPIYSSATFFILPAVALITLAWVYLVPSVFLYVGVMIFIGAEERQLTRAFGQEYQDYMTRVHRLVPLRRP